MQITRRTRAFLTILTLFVDACNGELSAEYSAIKMMYQIGYDRIPNLDGRAMWVD